MWLFPISCITNTRKQLTNILFLSMLRFLFTDVINTFFVYNAWKYLYHILRNSVKFLVHLCPKVVSVNQNLIALTLFRFSRFFSISSKKCATAFFDLRNMLRLFFSYWHSAKSRILFGNERSAFLFSKIYFSLC